MYRKHKPGLFAGSVKPRQAHLPPNQLGRSIRYLAQAGLDFCGRRRILDGLSASHRGRIVNKSIQTNEYQSVDGAEGEFLWSSPPQNVYLLPQRPKLCLKRCSRADQIDDHPTNKPAKIPHGTTASPDSLSTASQIRFATGTPPRLRAANLLCQ